MMLALDVRKVRLHLFQYRWYSPLNARCEYPLFFRRLS